MLGFIRLESLSESVSRSVVSDSVNPMDCSPPDSSVHGILQARTLEWVTISFSKMPDCSIHCKAIYKDYYSYLYAPVFIKYTEKYL